MLNAYTKHTPKTIPAHTPTYTMHTAKLYLMYAVETKLHQGLTPHYIQHIHRFFVKLINKAGDVCKEWRTVVRAHIRDSLHNRRFHDRLCRWQVVGQFQGWTCGYLKPGAAVR